MNIELIYDLDCPHIAAARSHLVQGLFQAGVKATWTEWDRGAADGPSQARQFGSPTILVDGRDVAEEQPRADSRCCRLYRDPTGAMHGVPSVYQIAAALKSNAMNTGSSSPPDFEESSGWKSSLATLPGIALAFLPKLACPACWPAYAGLLSSVGLGFLIQTKYLFPLTAAFLVLAIGALAFRARTRRGYGPFFMGAGASAVVLIGKFLFDSDTAMYGGIALLVATSLWNAWPRKKDVGCPTCAADSSNPVIHEKEMSS